jgi:hypothetical protein
MYHFLGSTDHFLDETNEILQTLWVVWLNIQGIPTNTREWT